MSFYFTTVLKQQKDDYLQSKTPQLFWRKELVHLIAKFEYVLLIWIHTKHLKKKKKQLFLKVAFI